MRVKFFMVAVLLVGSGLLSGCVVEQPGYGYGNGDRYRQHHHHHHDYDRD